jgi:tRNA pseudouridine55 synthase
MIVCTGKKTKEIERFQAQTKEYMATIRLGATTPSFDLETPIDATYPIHHITEEMVNDVLKKFIGPIEQVPPVFSACKIKGERAYKLARKNKDIELKPKLLVIDNVELLTCELPIITIKVVCSKGTYIRALARDIGRELGSGAHLTQLVRTRVGEATLDECLQVSELDRFFDENIKNDPDFLIK